MFAHTRLVNSRLSRLYLTEHDVSKFPSATWPQRSLTQWISTEFEPDEVMIDAAYAAITRQIADWMGVDPMEVEGISVWAERYDVSEDDIAAVWNQAMRELFAY